MKYHPLAEIFPLIEGDEFNALVDDIRTNGLRQPITQYHGEILDGRNRWRACVEAKIKPRFDTYTGDDPLGFVISTNIHRRQMSASQRGMAAARLQTTKHGGNRKSQDQESNSTLDRAAVCKMFNIGIASVKCAAIVQEKGVPELAKAVDRGALAVSRAASIAKKSTKDQQKFIANLASGSKPAEQRVEKPRGNKIIFAWRNAKIEDRMLFIETCEKEVRQLYDGLFR